MSEPASTGTEPDALRIADEAASAVHDYLHGRGDPTLDCDAAIWRIHDALRPMLEARGSEGNVVASDEGLSAEASAGAEPGLRVASDDDARDWDADVETIRDALIFYSRGNPEDWTPEQKAGRAFAALERLARG